MWITAQDVANWLRLGTINDDVAETHISIAESMVMAHMGVTTLDARPISGARHRILYDMDGDDVIEVREGPIGEFIQLTIGGSVSSAGSDGRVIDVENLRITPWTISRVDGEPFSKNSDVWMDYIAGYSPADSAGGGGTLPQRVRDAMIITAAEVYKSPDNQFDAEHIGDYSYQRSVRGGQETGSKIPLPSRAQLLLKGYRRPSSLI